MFKRRWFPLCDKSGGNWELGADEEGPAEVESEWYEAPQHTGNDGHLWTGTGPEMKFLLFLSKFLVAMPDLNSVS